MQLRRQQWHHHQHHHERALARSTRLNDDEQNNDLCETTTARIPWYKFLDHLCREVRYMLGDKEFCVGRIDPCFTCTATPPHSASEYYEMQQCRPTGAASYDSCSDEANFCRNEWNFTDEDRCPVNAQIANANLTGMGCCHQRVEMGQKVSLQHFCR